MTVQPLRASMPGFAALMAIAMASATIVVNSVGLLASELMGEFAISRAAVGGLATAFGIVAALTSIPAGHATDRHGGRRTTLVVLASAIGSLVVLAAAPNYLALLVALALGGIANAGANPGTNHLIGRYVPDGRRGLITGFKMSGVQLAVFAAGFGVPVGIAAIGWRATVAMIGLVPVVGVVWLLRMIPRDPAPVDSSASTQQDVSEGTYTLAVYTFLMSAATSAAVTYMPLFGEERLGLTGVQSGSAFALVGIAAVGGRISWGAVSERIRSHADVLLFVSVGSAAATAGILATTSAPLWIFWVAAIALGATASSFNAAVTMTLLRVTSVDAIGRASGIVFAGFLAGLAVGPVSFGAVVDASAGYTEAWIGTIATFLVAGALTSVIRRHRRR